MVKIAKTTENTSIGKISKGDYKNSPFEIWYRYMVKWEGGYVNDPDDPGGETNKGITLRTFQALASKLGYDGNDRDLFLRMPEKLHRKIAKEAFWNPVAKHIKNDCITIFIVDYIWGSGKWGIVRIQKYLKKLGERLKVDGIFGPQTGTAINKTARQLGVKSLLKDFMQIRRKHLLVDIPNARPSSKKYVRGWGNRLNDLEKHLLLCIKKNASEESY